MGGDRRILVACVMSITLAACEDGGAGARWAGTIDTLASGTVVVHNPAEGLWDDATQWRLTEDLRIGAVDGTGPDVFGNIADFDVDAQGRIWVLDVDATEVRVFDADGSYIRTIGRNGEGPGEFREPWKVEVDAAGRTWVVDIGNNRYSIFGADGSLIEEKQRFESGNVSPWPGAIMDDGRVVDVDSRFVDHKPRDMYVIHAADGPPLDTILMPEFDRAYFVRSSENGTTFASVPFAPDLVTLLDPRGYLWAGITDNYRVMQLSLNGQDTLRVIEKPYDPVPVTGSEKSAAFEGLQWFRNQGGRVDPGRIPDGHAAYRNFAVDSEGYLWVRPITARPDDVTVETLYAPRPGAFDVFNAQGQYLGRVAPTIPLTSTVIIGDHLYGITRDDLDVEYIVRLKIEGRASP